MAYLIKLSSKTSYWSGNEFAVWVDQASTAKEYSTKKEAEKDIKEISEVWGYTLEAVKADEAPSVEIVVESPAEGEEAAAPVVDQSLTAEELRALNS